MIDRILRIRNLYLVAVLFTLISSVFFLATGVLKSIHGYSEFLDVWFRNHSELAPGKALAEGLDAFLVALVFLVFGLGIMRLFTHYDDKDEKMPVWLSKISSFKELKILLWETILLTLVVATIGRGLRDNMVTLNDLILPGIIFILSLSLFLMKKEG